MVKQYEVIRTSKENKVVKAVIYARYSSDNQRRVDEDRSGVILPTATILSL